ncbi:serine hydrolase domain-containing protein [Blastococcus brunescens]|uniref:Serine hydrolase domain-containing protein n=1 Tax=Blastococcus brunescens TaxID=1564165 RepID=A0ABZ1B112_9ACTN|nr:serine hydrolase domain-containing protein [Blastococcus sp. BMG 8361]WRL63428.1 serine hydrolase domain-containing protein [Blastococcus sp. BMG 8361]
MPEPVLPATARVLLARTARAQREGRAPSLVAGVVRDGGLAWSAGRGDVPEPHTDVQYRLGSISKTVTAVVVMRLRDEGRLGLDDPSTGTSRARRSATAPSASSSRTSPGRRPRARGLVGAHAGRRAGRPRPGCDRRRPRRRAPLPLLQRRVRRPR